MKRRSFLKLAALLPFAGLLKAESKPVPNMIHISEIGFLPKDFQFNEAQKQIIAKSRQWGVSQFHMDEAFHTDLYNMLNGDKM